MQVIQAFVIGFIIGGIVAFVGAVVYVITDEILKFKNN